MFVCVLHRIIVVVIQAHESVVRRSLIKGRQQIAFQQPLRGKRRAL